MYSKDKFIFACIFFPLTVPLSLIMFSESDQWYVQKLMLKHQLDFISSLLSAFIYLFWYNSIDYSNVFLFECVCLWVYVCLRPCVIPFGNQYYEGRELTNLISFVCISTLYINGRLPMNFEKHFCFPCFFLCYNHHLCVCILPFIIYWTESNLKLPILPDTITCEQFMK